MASLVHMPAWVSAELNKLLFGFFWSGKCDLVARKVLAQPKGSGGFSVVLVEFEVVAPLVEWVRRLLVSPNGWVYLLTYWLLDRHGVPPYTFLSDPSSFSAAPFPPFYSDLFRAWRAVDGGTSSSGLTLGSSSDNAYPVDFKYLVWTQRNDFRFRSVPPSAVRIVAAIKARLHFYLPLFFKRFISSQGHRLFICQWAGNGVFGSISGSKFVCSF